MDQDQAIELGQEAVMTSLTLAAPFLIVGVVVAILLGIIQAMTHIQDQTVSFVPKIFLLGLTAVFCLCWCSERLVDYSQELYAKPKFIQHEVVQEFTPPAHSRIADTK